MLSDGLTTASPYATINARRTSAAQAVSVRRSRSTYFANCLLVSPFPLPGAVRSFIEVHMPWHMHGFGEALDALNASVHRRSVLLVTVLREPVAHYAYSWIYNGAQHCRECRTASDYVRAHPNLPATQLAQMRCLRQRARAPPA